MSSGENKFSKDGEDKILPSVRIFTRIELGGLMELKPEHAEGSNTTRDEDAGARVVVVDLHRHLRDKYDILPTLIVH